MSLRLSSSQLAGILGKSAKGKRQPRERGMNRLEASYARGLEIRKAAGEVLWFEYETVKLRLADNTFYTPDFFVLLADGTLEVHEVKGHWEDDARVKIKVAAEKYPFVFRAFTPSAGGWNEEVFE